MTAFIENNIYHHNQSDYRKHHSTLTIWLKHGNDIKKAMKSGKVTFSIFADYSKAFYTIDFDILLRKTHKT